MQGRRPETALGSICKHLYSTFAWEFHVNHNARIWPVLPIDRHIRTPICTILIPCSCMNIGTNGQQLPQASRHLSASYSERAPFVAGWGTTEKENFHLIQLAQTFSNFKKISWFKDFPPMCLWGCFLFLCFWFCMMEFGICLLFRGLFSCFLVFGWCVFGMLMGSSYFPISNLFSRWQLANQADSPPIVIKKIGLNDIEVLFNAVSKRAWKGDCDQCHSQVVLDAMTRSTHLGNKISSSTASSSTGQCLAVWGLLDWFTCSKSLGFLLAFCEEEQLFDVGFWRTIEVIKSHQTPQKYGALTLTSGKEFHMTRSET